MDLFTELPPEAQTRIQNGQIDLGFTSEIVYLAFGEPTRKYTRRLAEKTQEIWVYERTHRRYRHHGGHFHPHRPFHHGHGHHFHSSGTRVVEEWARVIFENNSVVEYQIAR